MTTVTMETLTKDNSNHENFKDNSNQGQQSPWTIVTNDNSHHGQQ